MALVSLAHADSTYVPPGPPDRPASLEEPPPEKTASSVVTAPQTLKTAVRQTTALISKRIAKVIAPRSFTGKTSRKPDVSLDFDEYGMGISAGDAEQRNGLWANIAIGESEDERLLTTIGSGVRSTLSSDSKFDLNNYIVGIDHKLTNKTVVGVAISYERAEGTTGFNAGDMDSDGLIFSPYFATLIRDAFSFDLTAGLGWVDVDQKRNKDGSKVPGAGVITASLESRRVFISASAKGYYNRDRWNLTGNVSYLYAEEEQHPFEESDGRTYSRDVPSNTTHLGQIGVGGELSYVFDTIEPYLNAAFEYDTTYDKDTSGSEDAIYDRNGVVLGAGFRFLLFSNALVGDIQATKVFGRDDYDEHSIMGNLRFEF